MCGWGGRGAVVGVVCKACDIVAERICHSSVFYYALAVILRWWSDQPYLLGGRDYIFIRLF